MKPAEPIHADVVVVGSGPNGLAAALMCARAGRSVVVLEAESTVGGGCRTLPMDGMPGDAGAGLLVDPCSAVHPMAGASPFFREFDLAGHGVSLVTPPVQLAHALPGRDAIVVSSESGVTMDMTSLAAGLGSDAEARAWRRLMGPLAALSLDVADAALSDQRSIPSIAAVTALATAFVRAHPRSVFGELAGDPLGPDGRTLLSGISAHAITPLTSPAATGVGLVLGSLLHAPLGWALPVGGSGVVTAALADAAREAGCRIVTGHRVRSLEGIKAPAIIFDTSSRVLGEVLLSSSPSPATARRGRRLVHARIGGGAAKVDLVLSGPVPWRDPRVADAGTIHLGGDSRRIATAEREVAAGRHAERPVVLVSQPWAVDPGRIASDGRRPLWTYAHVPAWSGLDVAEQVIDALDEVAPGIRDVVVAARCTPASRMAEHNANYAGGDIAAGRVDLLGLVARPRLRIDPYATGVPGVWHASASTPPGPGVHGMAGYHVARKILGH